MCMSDCCYNGFFCCSNSKNDCNGPKQVILQDCHAGRVVVWCGNDQSKLTTLSNRNSEGESTQSWLQARQSPLQGVSSICNPADALTFQKHFSQTEVPNVQVMGSDSLDSWPFIWGSAALLGTAGSAALFGTTGPGTTISMEMSLSGGRSLWSGITFSGDPGCIICFWETISPHNIKHVSNARNPAIWGRYNQFWSCYNRKIYCSNNPTCTSSGEKHQLSKTSKILRIGRVTAEIRRL